MKKDRGFSLIELLVVVAVMSVLVALLSVTINVVFSQRVSSAASDTKSLFQAAQTVAMSKDNCYVSLSVNGDGDIEITSYSSTTKQLDSVIVEDNIAVTLEIGGTAYTVSGSDDYQIRYIRESGAFDTVYINGVDTGKYCTKITMSKGSKTEVLQLSKLTGKITFGN